MMILLMCACASVGRKVYGNRGGSGRENINEEQGAIYRQDETMNIYHSWEL